MSQVQRSKCVIYISRESCNVGSKLSRDVSALSLWPPSHEPTRTVRSGLDVFGHRGGHHIVNVLAVLGGGHPIHFRCVLPVPSSAFLSRTVSSERSSPR